LTHTVIPPALAHWKTSSGWHWHKCHKIFVREGGEGPTLLLLHSFATASWSWHKLWSALSRHFRLIAVDFIGFGLSDKPWPYRYSLMDQADLIELLLRKKRVTAYSIMAHGYGASVAQELMARTQWRRAQGVHTPDLQSVTLLNGGIVPELHQAPFVLRLMASPLGKRCLPLWAKGRFRRNFAQIFGANHRPSEEEIDVFWVLLTHNKGLFRLPYLSNYLRERMQQRQRWLAVLQHPPAPLLHINGIADPISGAPISQWMQRHSAAQVIALEGVGHYPHLEAPEQLVSQFIHWLNQRVL